MATSRFTISRFSRRTPYRFQQTFLLGDPTYDQAVKQSGAYVDLRFKPCVSLAIPAGLRWDGQFNPSSQFAAVSISRTIWGNGQPRLGHGLEPGGTTTVRASSGIFDAPTPADIFARAFSDNGLHTIVADSYYDPEVLHWRHGGRFACARGARQC